ncbi:hypothetical protein CDL15_Pgr001217 [Punica granatum]|uniref:Cytochrome P450 94A2-like n=2 Tax=Punica granatum TaxID=22663 RepID=A0A218WKJ5_PUNGR|nr:hypothetical protein CDL15_Pgr001217 [Punica granatum]
MDTFFEQSLLLIYSSVILFLLHYIHKSISRPKTPTETTNSGTPKSYPLIGSLLDFIKNRSRFIDWTTEILLATPTNTILLRRPGMDPMVITANPSNVKHILMTNFDRYPKGELFTSHLRAVFGQVMFILNGEPWKDQRRIAVHEFSSTTFCNCAVNIIAQETHTMLIPILERASRMNHVLDLQEIFERFMFNILSRLMFSEDPGALSTPFVEAFRHSSFISHERLHHLFPFIWKTRLIETRGVSKDDIISRFIDHGDATVDYLRDIGIGFLLAGTDTTVSSLTWFFWILSSNPRVEKQIVEEVEAVRAKHSKNPGETFNFKEIREMHYLHAAITESMRLYPPVPFNVKTCSSDDVLPDGTLVKKGWNVLYNAFAMGTMEKIWGNDCLEYKPERWLEDGIFQQQSPFRYPIFNAGPRMCAGKDLAYIQIKLIVASMIERFVIEVQDDHMQPEKILSLTLLMKGGLPVKVRERCSEFKN